MESLRQSTHRLFAMGEEAEAAALRRAVSGYADRLRLTRDRRGLAELVATELATNLLRHAEPGGWVLARPVAPASIELIAVDRGPGIADLAAALDCRSPAPNGLGCGLAAVRRTAAYFDVHTVPGRGTTVLALVDLNGSPGRRAPPTRRRWAGVSIGLREACGDGWAATGLDQGAAVAVVDGLGHGVHASAAADAALHAFTADPADLDGFPVRANGAMRATRGGAAAVCVLQPDRGELRHLAVGNISGRILTNSDEHGLLSYNGTLGLHASPPRVKVTSYPWPPGATLVLWTDGLRSMLDLSASADLLAHDPAVIAATLHRDHSRDRDDATVVVVRNPQPP